MKKNNISFSVLMSVYIKDCPIKLQLALQSIFTNTVIPNQVILVVDGPVSESLKNVFISYCVNYPTLMQVLYLEKNSGLSYALNYGLNYVKNEWVFRADADDLNVSDRFESTINFINENPSCSIIGGYILEFDINGMPLHIRSVPLKQSDILQRLNTRSPFNHMTVAYKTSIVKSAGGYPHIHLKEDYALWAILLKTNVGANIPKVLVHASAGSDMYKRRGGLKYIKSEYQLQVFLYKTKSKSLPQAFFSFMVRSIVFSLPSAIRGFLYKNMLREKL